jgi:hypothetical protein
MTEIIVETPETAILSDFDVALSILEPMIEANAPEGDMGIELIRQGGFRVSRVQPLLRQVLESKGVLLSNKNRKAKAAELLIAMGFAPESWADVDIAATNIAEELDDTSKGQAISAIKAFAKENEIELPAKPKGEGGSRTSKDDLFYAWAIENPHADEVEVGQFIANLGVTEKQLPKYVNAYMARIDFARKFAEAVNA